MKPLRFLWQVPLRLLRNLLIAAILAVVVSIALLLLITVPSGQMSGACLPDSGGKPPSGPAALLCDMSRGVEQAIVDINTRNGYYDMKPPPGRAALTAIPSSATALTAIPPIPKVNPSLPPNVQWG